MPLFLLGMAPSMIQEIQHVSSRCGGGKSRETIKELIWHFTHKQPVAETYLFASKTLELSEQNYSFMLNEASGHPSATIPIKRVDSTSSSGSVTKALTELLEDGFKGIVFITHKTLATLPASHLRDIRVVIDEVPQDLAGSLMVKFDVKDQGHSWEKYLSTTPNPQGTDCIVSLAPGADHSDIKRRITDIRLKRDNTTTEEVADLLECLLIGNEPVYTSLSNSKGVVERVYQCVHYHQLKKLTDNVSFLTILSAQLPETLFGFIAEKFLGIPIVEKKLNSSSQLEKKHYNKVRIIPVLRSGTWSSTLLASPANETLVWNGRLVLSDLAVATYAQMFVERMMGRQQPFLLTLNKKTKMLESLESRGIPRTTTAVHGMNNYIHLHNAAYLAATNVTPFDERVFRKFAERRGLCGTSLLQSIKVERSYEAAYQCVARTSIRKINYDRMMRHVIVVPDMEYAKYLKGWFGMGAAYISASQSFVTKRAHELSKAKKARYQKVVGILTLYHQQETRIKDLVASSGISMTTYRNYLDEFRSELTQRRLLPLKSKRPQTKDSLHPIKTVTTATS